MRRPLRRNVLAAKPPGHYHYLTRPQTIAGKPITGKDYEGVHTTTWFDLAAGYATGTVEKCRCGWPLVLELDVKGLRAMPDVDAMLTAEEVVLGVEVRRDMKKIADSVEDIDGAVDAVDEEHQYDDNDDQAQVGDHWAAYATENFNRVNLPKAFKLTYKDEADAWAAFSEYVLKGTIAPEVLANLTSQRRWLTDFTEERVIRVTAFKPPWDTILDNWWEMDDEELTRKAEAIEAAGYDIVSLETIGNGSNAVQTKQVLWERSQSVKSGEFHGTSSDLVKKALPGIPLPAEPPFPVEEVAEDEA